MVTLKIIQVTNVINNYLNNNEMQNTLDIITTQSILHVHMKVGYIATA